MTKTEFENACKTSVPYLVNRDAIKKTIEEMAALDVNEFYKDGRFKRDENIAQIRSMCGFDEEETDTLAKMIDRLIVYKNYIDSIDDDEAIKAIEAGLFDYDLDADEELWVGPPGDEYQSQCLWSYYEAMHLISYIHSGFCVNTMRKGEI